MSEHNALLQEIEDDLDRKAIEAMWRKYGPWVIAAALGLVIAAGAYSSYQGWKAEKQQKLTQGYFDLLLSPEADKDKRIKMFETFAHQTHGSIQSTFARLTAASIASQNHDSKTAVTLYDAIASDKETDPDFRQLGTLLSVQEQMDDGNPEALQKRLQPLLAENAPWKYTAKQDAAFIALRAGDRAKAKQLFTELSEDANAPEDLAGRATDMARFLDE